MKTQKYFILFHINIYFSSISEKDRKKLIKDCYFPLLDLINISKNNSIAVEISALSLEIINKLSPKWVKLFKELIKNKKCELVGSGYSQIIGPLVPYEINKNNLKYGNLIYKKILGRKPDIALINEMVFSQSLIELYKNNGYKIIIFDKQNVDNLTKNNRTINYVRNKNKEIGVIWADSENFQRFQYYIHGSITPDQYFNYLLTKTKNEDYTCLYSSDAETFNYRTNRYKYERNSNIDEWKKIFKLLDYLNNNLGFKQFSIKNLFKHLKKNSEDIRNVIAEEKIILVKKQSKYNINRWNVTGLNDNKINSVCFNLFKSNIKQFNKTKNSRNLLEMWSSDYRTHITKDRWKNYEKKIKKFEANIKNFSLEKSGFEYKKIDYEIDNNNLSYHNSNLSISINLNKGLSIESLSFAKNNFLNIIGTIQQGKYKDIDYSTDYFSGNLLLEILDEKFRFTDLGDTLPKIRNYKNKLEISNKFDFNFGELEKKVKIYKQKEKITLSQKIKIFKNHYLILRPFHFTFLNSNRKNNLKILVKNGGKEYEGLVLKKDINHLKSKFNLVTSTGGFGATNQKIILEDSKNKLLFSWNKYQNHLTPMIENINIGNKRLSRLIFTVNEIDDTSKKQKINNEFLIDLTPI